MNRLHSFRPLADRYSRILILGTMPGPEALLRREYYGYPGNHFWRILADLFQQETFKNYAEKKRFLKDHHIALWDVIGSCRRSGASDAAIRDIQVNPIDHFVSRRRLQAIYLNGTLAERLYRRHFADRIHLKAIRLPSTSPAHASISYERKREAWKIILKDLENRNPWC